LCPPACPLSLLLPLLSSSLPSLTFCAVFNVCARMQFVNAVGEERQNALRLKDNDAKVQDDLLE
jgi:hypothetical protein